MTRDEAIALARKHMASAIAVDPEVLPTKGLAPPWVIDAIMEAGSLGCIHGHRAPADARNAARLDWLERHLFEGKWLGVIGQAKSWGMAGPYRHTLQQMRGETLRAAIDAAMAAPQPKE